MNNTNFAVTKTVTIKRKTLSSIPGLDESMRTRKIGATIYRGAQPLTEEEKKKYMPILLGLSSDSDRFEQYCMDYFANISVPVSPNGLNLEIGFNYKTLEDRDNANTDNAMPINVADYVLYRHCIVYSRVANTIADIGKSNNIEFFIEDASANAAAQDKANKLLLKAMNLMPAILNDALRVKQLIAVLNETVPESVVPKLVNDVNVMGPNELSVRLFDVLQKAPLEFIAAVNDTTIALKYFITRAINVGIIRKLANTSTLIFSSKTGEFLLGNNLNEVILTLQQEKNSSIFSEIKANLVVSKVDNNVEDIELFTSSAAIAKPKTPPASVGNSEVGIKVPK